MPQPVIANEVNGPKALIEVYSQQIVAKAEGFVAEAESLAINNPETYQRAQQVLIGLHEVEKAVEARRIELKRPLTQFGKAIDEIAHKLADPIGAAKRSMQAKLMAHKRAEDAKEAAAKREAEERVRQEREALEAERRRLEAEALAKAEAEARAAAEVLGVPVEPKPEPVVVPVAAAKPMEVPSIPTTPKASAVTTRRDKKLVIDDPSKVPFRIGDIQLMVPDPQAIKHALVMGLDVPGCRLIEVETPMMSPRRNAGVA
jgi:hypothetical protein